MTTWAIGAVLALSTTVPAPEPPSLEEVVAVPPELRAQLEARVNQQSRSPSRRLELLVDFMFDADGLALEYDHERTRTVEETFHSHKGNCLSFTLTFVALAREAGLTAYVQEHDQVLVRFGTGDTVFYSGHVNAGVEMRRQRHTVDFYPDVVAALDNPKLASDRRAIAHYYNNRGGELLDEGELASASRYIDAAIELDPTFAAPWNNRGVQKLREGDYLSAERAYLAALEQDHEHVPTLSNLVNLYGQLGQTEKHARFHRRLERVWRHDPIHSFILGLQHENSGDYDQAIDHYQRAVSLHRAEPRFHFGLARAYYLMGDIRRAERSLKRAYELDESDINRELYLAKLQSLRQ